MSNNRDYHKKGRISQISSLASRHEKALKIQSNNKTKILQIGTSRLIIEIPMQSYVCSVYESKYKSMPLKANKWIELLIKALKIIPSTALQRLGSDLNENYTVISKEDVHLHRNEKKL